MAQAEIYVHIDSVNGRMNNDKTRTTANTVTETREYNVEPGEVLLTEESVLLKECSSTEEPGTSKSQEERKRQIDAYALRGPRRAKAKDAWRKIVGQYTEDSPMISILDEGAKIREAERLEQC